jgi:catechol 2,3-dioxygenase-like lactoylglutathione lyase family enzyme
MATQTEVLGNDQRIVTNATKLDMKVEVIVIPVSDVERSAAFYKKLGWRLDVTPPFVVQFTPPGSWCSVQFGKNFSSAVPGSAMGYIVVDDIVATRNQLVAAGVEVSDFFHRGPEGQVSGLDPGRRSYFSQAAFKDPDGNLWLLQEVTARLPGRVDSTTTTFTSANDLATALRRAAAAHGRHEARTGQADQNWPDWYAEYMVRERSGSDLPQ